MRCFLYTSRGCRHLLSFSSRHLRPHCLLVIDPQRKRLGDRLTRALPAPPLDNSGIIAVKIPNGTPSRPPCHSCSGCAQALICEAETYFTDFCETLGLRFSPSSRKLHRRCRHRPKPRMAGLTRPSICDCGSRCVRSAQGVCRRREVPGFRSLRCGEPGRADEGSEHRKFLQGHRLEKLQMMI